MLSKEILKLYAGNWKKLPMSNTEVVYTFSFTVNKKIVFVINNKIVLVIKVLKYGENIYVDIWNMSFIRI